MFGPPCHQCGSEFNWLMDKDGEECRCGWPHSRNEDVINISKEKEMLQFAKNLDISRIKGIGVLNQSAKEPTKREDCLLDFWDSFINAVHLAGGHPSIGSYKNMTLQELGECLSQNGVRFTYKKEGKINE
jgi:hypothetical protein